MNILELFKKYKLGRILFTTVLPIFIGLVAIFLMFYLNKTEIRYEILASTNVFDINENIENIDILYNKESLKEKNENLKIISLKIKNSGKKHIIDSYYNDTDLLGFNLQNGKIIKKPEILEASTDHLNTNLMPNLITENEVRFSKTIFDSKDYVILKILILHEINTEPKIVPIGKIAGVKEIKLIDLSRLEEKSFFNKVFMGNIFVQIIRGLIYFIVVLALIIVIAFCFYQRSKAKDRKKRKKIVTEFKELSNYTYSSEDDPIFNFFIKKGVSSLSSVLDASLYVKEQYQKYVINPKEKIFVFFETTIQDIIQSGLVIEKVINGRKEIIVHKKRKETLNKLIQFIKQSKK